MKEVTYIYTNDKLHYAIFYVIYMCDYDHVMYVLYPSPWALTARCYRKLDAISKILFMSACIGQALIVEEHIQ